MKPRKINALEFKKQLEEHVVGDGIVDVELNAKESIKMRLTMMLDPDVEAEKPILDKLAAAEGDVDATLAIVLDVPGQEPEAAIEIARKAGITKGDLFIMWNYEQREAQEQLGNFRFKASKS